MTKYKKAVRISVKNIKQTNMADNKVDYNFTDIEKYWQKVWDEQKTFAAEDIDTTKKPKYYILDMFPYPSGAGLHIGHPEGYTASDIIARYKWANGYNVLHPMGWDAFGLPAEQYAVKTGTHPAITTASNIDNFRRQIKSIGFAIDWSREINTTDPKYYKWTQWIFLKLFAMGLAYVDEKPVWWCPALGTVLANEEVVDGKSEVGKFPVERRKLRQWVLRITAYADKLIDGLKDLDWPESTKRLQTNWIGRSEGAEVDFEIANSKAKGKKLRIYTTRPDTLYGATYMVIAPEHPLVDELLNDQTRDAVAQYKASIASKSDLDRTDLAKDKTGVFTGAYAINPVNGKQIPIWIADYVLMSYGTGAIMAVPAHDERDYDFAVKFDLPIIRVIDKKNADGTDVALPFTDVGKMINSGRWDGTDSLEGKKKITEMLEEMGVGKKAVNYKIRDWLFSRQRYWGEPFPIVWVEKDAYEIAERSGKWTLPKNPVYYTGDDGRRLYALPLPEKYLPLELPKVDNYKPSGTGESPLAHATNWLKVMVNPNTAEVVQADQCKDCAGFFEGHRETNTMPQWAGSCWYYLRYCSPDCDFAPIDPKAEKYWQYPDFYIGGAEHAVLHLLYARFWHKALYDCGVLTGKEPFKKLFHQGIILGQLEFTGYKKDGKFVGADRAGEPGVEPVKLSEADVEKAGSVFVLKADKSIVVDARSFKMSKSRGNVVNPDDIIAKYGADALRLYEMFLGPLEDQKPWNTNGIEGVWRFLKKVWREYVDAQDGSLNKKISANAGDSNELLKLLNQTIIKVGADIETLRFNTAISQMMIYVGMLQKQQSVSLESAAKFVQLLAPFAPHIAEELWARLGMKGSVAKAPWPKADESKICNDTHKIAVQVNGKLRGELQIDASMGKDDILAAAKNIENVKNFTDKKTIVKEIYVPNKIVNIVVK